MASNLPALKQPKNARVVSDQCASVSMSFGKMAIIAFKWYIVIGDFLFGAESWSLSAFNANLVWGVFGISICMSAVPWLQQDTL